METIRLPKNISNIVACADLGKRLRAGTILLDWSEVEHAEHEALVALLEGLTLDTIPDGLGLSDDSIPESLQGPIEIILRANAAPKTKTTGKNKSKAKGTTAVPEPAATTSAQVWQGEPEPPPKKPSKPPAKKPSHPPASLLQSEIPSPAEIRAELEKRVLAELCGPATGETEEIDDPYLSPRERYLVGLVAPSRLRVAKEEMDSLPASTGSADADDDSGDEDKAPANDTMFPSSIGLSFCVTSGTKLRVRARWGRYTRSESDTKIGAEGKPLLVWKRSPMGGEIGPIEIKEGMLGPWVMDSSLPQVVVRGIARRVNSILVVSLFLVNQQDEPAQRKDEGWVFQPELIVRGDEPSDTPFLGRAECLGALNHSHGAEEQAVSMLFRNEVEFAVGHGVSVHCERSKDNPRLGTLVSTTFVPRYELPAQEARRPPKDLEHPDASCEDINLAGLVLDMKELSGRSENELRAALSPLLVAYESWIAEQTKRINNPNDFLDGFEQSARNNLEQCSSALQRLRRGVELVCTDAIAGEAFRFANKAMWLQRVHTVLSEQSRRGKNISFEDVDTPSNRSWRTFQLAFVLLTLEGITRLDHPDRVDADEALADLLWFPTGGGKTEAYLGCTAYVLAMRRLQGEIEGRSGEYGVAVLMRYTLRLLTIQQFQRAATLICACESIRRQTQESGDLRYGEEPFRLGLWVGAKTTPNWTADANESLKLQKKVSLPTSSVFAGSGSPIQLKSCPWCGTSIDPSRHMRVDTHGKGVGRTLVFCGDERGACLFSQRQSPREGIPVLVVDEEIYRRLPALLIATVDKFAQMPWNPQIQMLFGRVTGRCTRHGFRSPETEDSDSHKKEGDLPAAKTIPCGNLRPPDLIIQDELHLINGPLGTLTALYETAVDDLCSWQVNGKTVRPKIIASTATVRRAREQVHSLFARQLSVFPPPGLDTGNSFFAIPQDTSHVPGRLYLGLCAPGRRIKAAMIRIYVAFLTAAQSLHEVYGVHADPWMTLVGYFGSLRELAGTRRLVDDDVRNRAFRVNRTGLSKRGIGEPRELTSRLGATDIPALLDLLEVPFDPSNGPSQGEPRRKGQRPVDVLLATNMISVGVDVKRLGLMVCAGQPKTTAEYIQATSRVGRSSPGLVCTLYNWARPRDLSHYETFEHYHATFYQHVEALSVTPFASRALDRGLSALLVSLIRQASDQMNANDKAALIDPKSSLVKQAVHRIVQRAEKVEEDVTLAKQVKLALEVRLQEWQARATPKVGGAKLGYRTARDGETEGLLQPPGIGEWDRFTCLQSLRDVEPSVTLLLDEGPMEEQPSTTGGAQ